MTTGRALFTYHVGHRLTGDGIDCGTTFDLSRFMETIQGRYGALISMDTPLPHVVRFWTHDGYLVVLSGHGSKYLDEELSQLSEGCDLS